MATKTASNGFYSYIDENNHHDLLRVIALIVVLAIIAVSSWFFMRPEETVFVPQMVDEYATRQALLSQPNQPVDISGADLKSRQELLASPNLPTKMTVEEIEMRMRLLQGGQ